MSNFDKDLALAISLSLQDQHSRATNSKDDPILIIDSSDEEDLPETSKPAPSKRPLKPFSSRSTSSVSELSSMKSSSLASQGKTIDTDATLDIGDEDTATEDESDEEVEYIRGNPVAIDRKNLPSQVRGTLLVPLASGSSRVVNENSARQPQPSLSPLSSFRADRAKMEQERLARLKRRLPEMASQGQETHEDEDSDDNGDTRPLKRPSPALAYESYAFRDNTSSKVKYAGSFNVPDGSGLFWHGALRQTANKHANATQDKNPVFRLTTDILPPSTAGTSSSHSSDKHDPKNALSFAIVSTYALELPWLYSLFPPEVPVILVTQPGQDGRADVHHTLPGWVRASPALPGGRGCMHVKLFYKDGRLRIVVPTANLVPHDWRDIENSVWLQDVPLRTTSSPSVEVGTSKDGVKIVGFAEKLERVLKALNVAPALEAHLKDQRASGEIRLPLRTIDELHSRWDWSRVTACLIPSIAGKHSGWPDVLQVGHVALMKAIRDRGVASEQVKIECQGSSIGAYSTQWTNEFMSSTKGISPETWLDVSKTRRAKASHPTGLKIVFPSLRTVESSVLGRPAVGRVYVPEDAFPRQQLEARENSYALKGMLPDETESKYKGWLYVGSHNFTPSAWGNLSGSGFTPIMNLSNYELGIVMPLESLAQGDQLACWKRPARPYVQGEDEPWMQTEHR
ncbi:Tyrosyl-DNA phosphodiesterase [Ceratobasidium theobromae]|uniref:Tyrosyl-DNA phosphodiesterase n=1 Tax=Ceratobasidium theobromae TaxID=1582974 RepID=A0A5N5QB47_9AGAM|nr:Tyrosyl-DNA phosphodiesterase [Ceratobasidium theobromae]